MNQAELEKSLEQIHSRLREFLPRWAFEQHLDALALIISKYLSEKLKVETGCSLIYRGDKDDTRCYVGGSSSDRRKMEPSARIYDLAKNRASFTSFAITRLVGFSFDDFPSACEALSKRISHKQKACELPSARTLSFWCYPFISGAESPILIVKNPTDLQKLPSKIKDTAIGAIRISTFGLNHATTIDGLLLESIRRRIFEAIETGRSRYLRDQREDAHIIAEFENELWRFRDDEYGGLDRLTAHLQSIFGNCECSVFIAEHNPQSPPDERRVALRLAATTCLSESSQHQRFRKTFWSEDKHYVCVFRPNGEPLPNNAKWAKTEEAFYRPDSPLYYYEDPKSRRFPGSGEIKASGSFLAIAIRSRVMPKLPYGVVRIVSESTDRFDEHDRRLADAIAQCMTVWMELFPKNEELEIRWANPADYENVCNSLAPSDARPSAETEITRVLQKLFAHYDYVDVRSVLRCEKNLVVLLGSNQHGREFIIVMWPKGGTVYIPGDGLQRETISLKAILRPIPGMDSDEHAYIVRSTEDRREIREAAVALFSFFSTVLRSKLPQQKATVRVMQDGTRVTMIVETEVGAKLQVEGLLDEYRRVIVGDLSPEDFLESRVEILMLRNRLSTIKNELDFYKELAHLWGSVHGKALEILGDAVRVPGVPMLAKLEVQSEKIETLEQQLRVVQKSLEKVEQIVSTDRQKEEIREARNALDKLVSVECQDKNLRWATLETVRKIVRSIGESGEDIRKATSGVTSVQKIVKELLEAYDGLAKFLGF